jgi:hypothetical protein
MSNILKPITLLLFFLATACASLTPGGRKVRFTGQVLPQCEFLGAADPMENVLLMEGNLENALRNKAAEMGGNWVVLTGFSGKPSGDVYKCPEGAINVRQPETTINLNIKDIKNP